MDYGLVLHKIPIMCDNTSAISIIANPVNHSRTKHIDVRFHFIREHATNGTIELIFVATEKQLADFLLNLWMKQLSLDLWVKLKCLILHPKERTQLMFCSRLISSKSKLI